MPRYWTNEERARQAEICRQNRPWEASSGPRTPEGKARSSRNAYKGDPVKRARRALRAGNPKLALRIISRHCQVQRESR